MPAKITEWPQGLREPDMPALRALVDAIPSRVSLVTPDHRYLYANSEFLRFVGLTVGELVEAAGAGRRQLFALAIVWMCKLGLLDWSAT